MYGPDDHFDDAIDDDTPYLSQDELHPDDDCESFEDRMERETGVPAYGPI